MLGIGLGITSRLRSSAFNPASLFRNGEQGAWYDPSDLTTLFQDTAGTTPVTAAGQTVGLMLDKSQGLVLGSELSGSVVINVTGGSYPGDIGGKKLTLRNSDSSQRYRLQLPSTAFGGSGFLRVSFTSEAGGGQPGAVVDVQGAALVATVGPGTYTYIVNMSSGDFFIQAPQNNSALISNLSIRKIEGNHATQPTASARPVYQVDAGGRGYLAFDGVDDFLVTPTITPGIDKVQVFAGVRKLSDSGLQSVIGHSANPGSINGTFEQYFNLSTAGQSLWLSRGTANSSANAGSGTSPTSIVTAGLMDIAGDAVSNRNNGVQIASSASDQGTGNYLAYPMYIGRRGGTSLPFNGNLYSLIARFGANLTADQITATETWVAAKTGVTL